MRSAIEKFIIAQDTSSVREPISIQRSGARGIIAFLGNLSRCEPHGILDSMPRSVREIAVVLIEKEIDHVEEQEVCCRAASHDLRCGFGRDHGACRWLGPASADSRL
jgi:hypothetical protein